MSWAKRTACSSGRLTRRLARTDSSSLIAASAIPTIVSASFRVSSRSESESPWLCSSRFRCSSRHCIKSLIPMGRDYIGSEAGLQEDLPRHLARALSAGAFFGEPAGPGAQEKGDRRGLLQRPVGPLHAGFARGLCSFLPQYGVEGVGKDAGAGVAHERSLHEGPARNGRTEGKEGHFEGVCNVLFQVCPDDQIRLRGFEAGRDLVGIFFHESPLGESVGVEEEVPGKVREIRPAGDYLQPDFAGQGVTEAKGVGEVPADGDPAVLEGLGGFEPRV